MAIIAGIDYSYTSPAICVYDTSKELKFENLKFFNFYHPKKKKGYLEGSYGNIVIETSPVWESQEQRFSDIRDWSARILQENSVEEVVLEGYAMGSKGGLVFDIAENTSLLKQVLYENKIIFLKHAPTAVKKEFTGMGNAKKELMVETFEKMFGIKLHEILGVKEFSKPIDDIVDSYANLSTHPLMRKN